MIKFTNILVVLVVTLLIPQMELYASVFLASKDEMIKNADIIVIADIMKVENKEITGKYWTYRQKVTAKVEQVLKGKLDQEIVIYGMEDFICASCRFEKGKFLLFLMHDQDFLICSNWNLSIRPIKDKNVEWFKKNSSNNFKLKNSPLENVIKEIKSKVQE